MFRRVNFIILIICCCSLISSCLCDLHQDSRCLCKCPDVSTARPLNGTSERRRTYVPGREEEVEVRSSSSPSSSSSSSSFRSVYIDSGVGPNECDCEHVVLPEVKVDPNSFCPRCQCQYETRNLTIMKVIVILVIWVMSILTIYMAFLKCLDPILKKDSQSNYREQINEDNGTASEALGSPRGEHPMRHYGTSVIQRLGHTQSRWSSTVQEQRRNIYDRHSMLN